MLISTACSTLGYVRPSEFMTSPDNKPRREHCSILSGKEARERKANSMSVAKLGAGPKLPLGSHLLNSPNRTLRPGLPVALGHTGKQEPGSPPRPG